MPIFQRDFVPYPYDDCLEQGISTPFFLEIFGHVHNIFLVPWL